MPIECSNVMEQHDTKQLINLVNTEQYEKLEETWLEIVESEIKDLQGLLDVVDLINKKGEKKRAHDLLLMLEPYYKEKGFYNETLRVLKKVLEHYPKEKGLAEKISECYLHIYKDRPQTQAFFEKVHTKNIQNINDIIKKLEKYFYLDCGDYIYHKSWGVGQVVSIDTENEKLIIDFEKKNNHSIATDIAPDILQKLENDNLFVMAYAQKDILEIMAEKDPVGLIKLALKNAKGKASVSEIKEQLTSIIIPSKTWSKWWTNTKKLIKKDPYLKYTEGTPTNSFIELRSAPKTQHQELLEKITHIKDINKGVAIAKKYLSEIKDSELCRNTLHEITNFFLNESEKAQKTNPALSIECLLLLEQIKNIQKEEPDKYKNTAKEFLHTVDNITQVIHHMHILEYKKQALGLLKMIRVENWPDDFATLFFLNQGDLWEYIIKELVSEDKKKTLEDISHKIFSQFNAYPEHYFWFCKNGIVGRYSELYRNIDPAMMFIQLVELLNNINFKIQKGQNGNLRTIQNKIQKFMDSNVIDFALTHLNDGNVENIFNTVCSCKGLEDWFKFSLENVIHHRFPHIVEKSVTQGLDETKIYVTREGYEKQTKELDHLMNVEFPENARDLGDAISRGDLRENAEYKAAREKQAMLVEKTERIKAELQKAVLIDSLNINTNTVSPGTTVTLKDLEKDTTETYTILGPWDVNIEKGIISYLSPIGKGLLNKKAGNLATIKLPDSEITYEIIKIEKA